MEGGGEEGCKHVGRGKKRREDDGNVQVRTLFGLQIKKRDGMQMLIGFPGALASKDEHIK